MTNREEPDAYAVAALHVRSTELTPEMISERLGLQATRVQRKGEMQELDELRWRYSTHCFILSVQRMGIRASAGTETQLLHQVVDEVLGAIEAVADKLQGLRSVATPELVCAYGSVAGVRELSLSVKLLQRIVALELPLTVYPFRMEKRPDDSGPANSGQEH